MDSDKKEVGKWVVWIIVLFIGVVIVFSLINYVGLGVSTVVERKVFEQSYQKQAADSDAISAYDAQLTILRRRLRASDITTIKKTEIQGQIDSINILKASKGN